MVTELHLLETLCDEPANSVLLLDFDGTLSPIVLNADEAQLFEEEIELLHRLSRQLGTVAIVSGRPGGFLIDRLAMKHQPNSALRAFGRGGLDRIDALGSMSSDPTLDNWLPTITSLVKNAHLLVPDAWIEEKGVVITLHWRKAPQCEEALRAFATKAIMDHSLVKREGKMSIELFPPSAPSKATIVRELAERGSVIAFFGDDVSDLEAFDALDEIKDQRQTLRVGVLSDEAPSELLDRADLVLDSPAAVIRLLQRLSTALGNT
jgi:trehalose 6-phosphate phosphatase